MTNETDEIVLSKQELREVARFAAECAQEAVYIFESDQPADPRPRDAIDAARTFAGGGERTNSLRESAGAANKAARGASTLAACHAARAAGHAAAAAYLHPLARFHQVEHILGAAVHAARAAELLAGGDRSVGADHVERARRRATPTVIAVLERYPAPPLGGDRVAELLHDLDAALRS